MSLTQILQQSGVIESMARELGTDTRTAQQGAGALLPAIVAGMGRSANGSGGLGGLAGAILGGGGGGMLDTVLGQGATPTGAGNDVLGTIFGGKEVSRGVASEVAAATGLDEGLLKKMLPILAMAVAGYMAKQAMGNGLGNTGLGNTGSGAASPASATPRAGAGGGALGGLLGSIVTGMMTRR